MNRKITITYILKITLLFLLIEIVVPFYLFAQDSDEQIELIAINFTGNENFSATELKTVIISKESPGWLSKFLNKYTNFGSPPTYFDSLAIDKDIAYLESFYKDNGFFKIEITDKYQIESKKKKKEATLTFNIKEGPVSKIRKIVYTGLDTLSQKLKKGIKSVTKIEKGDKYSALKLEENNLNIVNYLKDNGYMLAENSKPVVEIDTTRNIVDISIDFKLGNRYKISEVTVEKTGVGKNLVSDELIKEITNIKPNHYYNYHDLQLAQVRLYRTNLFSSAIIGPNNFDTTSNFVPIKIATNVGLLNEISPEVILINDENTFKLGLGLSFIKKNFLGDARKLTISTSAAAKNITQFITNFNLNSDKIFGVADFRITLEQPFLFGKPINTKLETFGTVEKKEDEWNANIYGVNFNLDFELSNYTYLTSLSTYTELQNSKYIFKENYIRNIFSTFLRREVYNQIPAGPYLDSLINTSLDTLVTGSETSSSNNVFIGVRLGANKTDDLLFPTRGYSLSLLLEEGNSIPYLISKLAKYDFNQAAYYKVVLTSTFYLPFLKQGWDAFGLKFKIGNIQTYSGNPADIPLNQRFSVGGSNSLRGWKARDNSFAIHEATLPANPTKEELENIFSRGIAPGGFFLFEGSVEARTHLNKTIGAAIFIDYGNVWFTPQDFRFDRIAVATGFGFRYYSEFVPVRFDIGFKLYNPNDRRNLFERFNDTRGFLNNMEFQLGIGEAF